MGNVLCCMRTPEAVVNEGEGEEEKEEEEGEDGYRAPNFGYEERRIAGR